MIDVSFRIRSIVALLALALAAGFAQAQETPARSCIPGGHVYPAGVTVFIEGKTMICDGQTGSWVAVDA